MATAGSTKKFLLISRHSVRDELPVVLEELSWTHYRLLLKVERPDIRNFYMEECIAGSWSTLFIRKTLKKR